MDACRQAGASVAMVSWVATLTSCGTWTDAVLDAATAGSTWLILFYMASMSVIAILPRTSRPSIPVLQVGYAIMYNFMY